MGLRDRMVSAPKREVKSTISRTPHQMAEKEKLIVVNLHLSEIQQAQLQEIQKELSWFRKPIQLPWVFDWLFLRAKEIPTLEDELRKIAGIYQETFYTEFQKTSVRVEDEIAEWMASVTGTSKQYKAPNITVRWLIDEWPRIKKLVGFQDGFATFCTLRGAEGKNPEAHKKK